MEFHSPAVSVIIPIYNVEKYLAECLDSAVNQTLQNIEIICVDDGSPDRSADIAAEYAKKYDNVKLIRKENGGQSSARNVALDIACGQYIYFLDSDDYLERNALEELYTRAVEDDLDLLFFNAVPFFESRLDKQANASYIEFYRREGSYAGVHTGQTMFAMMRKNGEFLGSPCFEIIRRSLIEENGLRFYDGIIHEDNLLVFQCAMLANRAGYTDRTYYHRRLHGGTIMTTRKSMRNVEGYLVSYAEMLHFLHDRPVEEAAAPLISDYLRFNILGSARSIFQTLDIPSEELVLSKGGFCATYFLNTIKGTSDTAWDSVSLRTEVDTLRKALQTMEQQYESSFTFRVGRIVTLPLRLAKRAIGCLRENGLRLTLRKIAKTFVEKAQAADERLQEKTAYRLLTCLPRQVRHNLRWVRNRGVAYVWRSIRMKVHLRSHGSAPLVSIILPVYNVEPYLEECLDSLRKQTLKSIEIIAVDDGSTDRSLEILNRYAAADRRIHVYTKKNQYAGAARNVGLSHATGEYLLFLDSDDFFSKNLAKDAYIAGKAANADVVLFGAKHYDNVTGEYREAKWLLQEQFVPQKQPFSYKDCPDDFFYITTPCPWTKLFRRQFILDSGLQFQQIQNSNDVFFTFSALPMAQRIVTLNEPLVFYRVGLTNNLQTTKKKHPLCFYEAYLAWHDKLAELGVLADLRKSYVNLAASGCIFNLRTLRDLDAKRHAFEKLKEGLKTLESPGHQKAYIDDKHNLYTIQMVENNTFEEYLSECEKDTWKSFSELQYKEENEKHRISQQMDRANRREKGEPILSILIPVYNVEAYLKDCLESVANQSMKDIEIICVDDKSTDRSGDILDEYARKDSRFKVFHKEKNEGPMLARKKAEEMATSEYVIFVDADDLLDPELCHFAEHITLSESADIIQYSIGIQDFSNDPEKVKWLKKALAPLPQMLRAPDVLKKAFVSREYTPSLSGKIMKAELCKKAFAMLPEEKGRIGEDIFTYFYLAYYAKSYLGVNTKDYYIYRHGLGITDSEVMSLSKFEMYCKMAYWPQYVHNTLLSNNSECAVQQSYNAMVVRMAQDCCNIYRNRMNPKDKLSAMKILITYWDGIPEAEQIIRSLFV